MVNHVKYNRTRTAAYLIWTFGLAWIMQAGAALLYQNGNAAIGQLVMAVMMFVPMLGVLLSGGRLTGMGWNPHIRRNIKMLLIAWFAPALLTAVGAVLYFVVFPGHFDLSGKYLAASAGAQALKQLEEQGLSYPMYVLASAAGCITYAPLINMVLGLGEEAGWRGFLYPQLKAKYGRKKGRLLGGIIWGAWHWPVIWLIGYEYGTEYVGFPIVGMLVFCVFTIAAGILCDWLYEKSQSIWTPSICHGAVNAAGTVPLAVCLTDTGSARLLGPAPMGIIAGLPLLLLAGALCLSPSEK